MTTRITGDSITVDGEEVPTEVDVEELEAEIEERKQREQRLSAELNRQRRRSAALAGEFIELKGRFRQGRWITILSIVVGILGLVFPFVV